MLWNHVVVGSRAGLVEIDTFEVAGLGRADGAM